MGNDVELYNKNPHTKRQTRLFYRTNIYIFIYIQHKTHRVFNDLVNTEYIFQPHYFIFIFCFLFLCNNIVPPAPNAQHASTFILLFCFCFCSFFMYKIYFKLLQFNEWQQNELWLNKKKFLQFLIEFLLLKI